jgi:hypothetical protein
MPQAVTSARVDLITGNNTSFVDAFQFGTLGDTSWSFSGQSFRMDIKGNKVTQSSPLVSFTSGAGQIVVDDPVQRILHFNVAETVLSAAGIVPGEYWYDLIMFDGSSPAVRIALMEGKFKVYLGVTGG